MESKISRFSSFLIIAVIYLLAACAGYITYRLFADQGILISMFLADAAATIVVWLFGILLKNSSVYDPYWSVAPIALVGFWFLLRGTALSFYDALLLFAILFWGIRLTCNWSINWHGMTHVDWRYEMLKDNNKNLWHVINFGGINMMPTILVYLGLVPAYYIIFEASHYSALFYAGFAVAVAAPVIQLIADKQMKDHRAKKTSGHIKRGLWKYSRHPNYFGEIIFWWGIFIMQLGCVKNLYMSSMGAVLITLLFVFVSIPMMEKHIVQKYPDYEIYQENVSMVVPWHKR